jgi:hypothetical protein
MGAWLRFHSLTPFASPAAAHLSCRLSKNIMRSTTVAAAAFALLLLASSAAAGRQLKDTAGRQLLSENAVDLGFAGNYVILAKAGISTVPSSIITGDIGVSPISLEAVTGFSLLPPTDGSMRESAQVTGKIFAADLDAPTPGLLTTAISNVEAAYTDAAGRLCPIASRVNLGAGILDDVTLTAGVYKWSTGVLITGPITISGTSTDIFIFQIDQTLTMNTNKGVVLQGGALAKNIFWQVAETVSFGAGAHFEGIILAATGVTFETGSSLNGRIFSQTAVALQMATITQP